MSNFKDYVTDAKVFGGRVTKFLTSHGTVRNLAIGFAVGFVVAKLI